MGGGEGWVGFLWFPAPVHQLLGANPLQLGCVLPTLFTTILSRSYGANLKKKKRRKRKNGNVMMKKKKRRKITIQMSAGAVLG